MDSSPETGSPVARRAVVLAGRRPGEDPLARAAGAPHRALLEIEGEPMLLRVVERLLARPGLERVLVSIDAPDLLHDIPGLAHHLETGRVELLRSTDSPSLSVLESLDRVGLGEGPVLVTTADHALLDDAMLDAFFSGDRPGAADLLVGLVSRTTIESRFPEARRTYLRFRDDAYSGANLFLFRTPAARGVAAFWRRVEQERKRPWRIARAFGLTNLLLFLTRRLSLDEAMQRASRVVGARVEAVRLPIAEAAVDVDKLDDLELVRTILAQRRADRERP
ncbi:MAG: nucleotidyltransferase family protein [Deltaproteobacteria bacterium]|nr:nucleotidyltransferase family protein [Deltaproteobacteria bacterium]